MKKFVALLLAVLMVASLCACGQKDTGSDLQTVTKGKLIMSTNAEFAPYEYVADDGKGFQGTIAADLNDKGTAEWIVISSSVVVPYEKKTSSSDSTKAGKLDVTTVEYASGAYNVTATVTKELKGVKSYTVKLTTVNGAVIAEKSADVTGTGDYAVKDTATVTLTSAQKKAEEANVEFTFFDKDGNVLASASGLFAL